MADECVTQQQEGVEGGYRAQPGGWQAHQPVGLAVPPQSEGAPFPAAAQQMPRRTGAGGEHVATVSASRPVGSRGHSASLRLRLSGPLVAMGVVSEPEKSQLHDYQSHH